MGRETMECRVRARVSRHNSDEDKRDNQLWMDMLSRIESLIQEPQYAPIKAYLN